MLILRIGLGLVLAYVALVVLAWLFQERLAFPAPRAPVPDPRRVGVANGEKIELVTKDGTRLVGWYLAPQTVEDGRGRSRTAPSTAFDRPRPPSPALLWFYGNGENIATIWPILREFQPSEAALLVADYPGYGGSDGRASEAGMYAAADAAYAALAARPEVDPRRIFVYGRSLGSAAATYTATRHPVAGLILESPFTNAADMARDAYRILPRFILRLSLDNLGRIKQVRCPLLLFHGTDDRLVPVRMGMRVAAAAAGPVEVVLIQASGHNETYEAGGESYRSKVAQFVR
ncbi:MAG TPA: alpha/beta fold hydrolase [Gemmatimonadales bacterium]|nr:alpha/beta fold hydrolase [Gemmatimonadales bacterium]